MTAAVTPRIHRLCGWIEAGPRCTGASPENAGSPAGFLPSTSITRLFAQMAMPIVVRVTPSGLGRRSRRTTA